MKIGTKTLKEGFAKMQKGGVIMDVVTPKQALIAEKAGAVAVMALHAVPADIRARGGVARMADPAIIEKIMKTVTIPVMAKVRIGHFAEAQVLEELGVDMIDESEVLTPADEQFHIDKKKFKIPFVCGARNLGEALRRMNEGAAMIRTKGEPGTGDVAEAVKHVRQISREVEELVSFQKHRGMNFAAGGIATPADAALMMQLGVDGIFVGSGVFKSSHPERYAKAIVEATRSYGRPEVVLKVSKGLGDAMHGIDAKSLQDSQKMQLRSH
ncbi:MAG: pyridoxal 5'-phosphate synthase subunit PdxS [Candidatus Micrarchaeota archaeon]|nr:pyridoxal 5'-phosphate synthase subunit PdxS [Candidatus Micrarchaeota archaeon]